MQNQAVTRARMGLAAAALALALGCGSEKVNVQDASDSAAPAIASDDGGSNHAPVIRNIRIDPFEPTLGSPVRAIVSVSDPDGDRTTLHYEWRIDGNKLANDQREISLAGASKGAHIEVVATASDGHLESEPVRATASVINRAPTVTGVGIDPSAKVPPGNPIKAVAQAHDPDGDPVSFEYHWEVNGTPVANRGSVFSTQGLKKGDKVRVAVTASDGTNQSTPMRSVEVSIGSSHPEITSVPPGMDASGVFRYPVVAKDPDGDRRLRYRLGTAPEGMVIDEIYGVVVWKPRQDQVGVHPVAIIVEDSTGLTTTQKFEITVALKDSAPAAPATRRRRR
jgi:Putative Ig domain